MFRYTKINKFRKANDGGNLLLVGVAVGTIALIGMYLWIQPFIGEQARITTDVSKSLSTEVGKLDKLIGK